MSSANGSSSPKYSGGRPELPASKKRTHQVTMRLNDAELKDLNGRAEDAGLSRAAYVRKAALRRVVVPRQVREARFALMSMTGLLRRIEEAATLEEAREAGRALEEIAAEVALRLSGKGAPGSEEAEVSEDDSGREDDNKTEGKAA